MLCVCQDFKLSICDHQVVQKKNCFTSLCFLDLFEVCVCVCVCYLCAPGEAGPYYSRQELAVYGGGWDDLRRGHGGDALKSLLLGILVLHGNKHTLFQVLHGLIISHQDTSFSSERQEIPEILQKDWRDLRFKIQERRQPWKVKIIKVRHTN